MKHGIIRRTAIAALATAAALTVAPETTEAYSYRTCNGNKIVWGNGWTNLYLNTISFTPGGIWDTRAQNMMAEWNAVPRSGFRFYYGRDTDGTVSTSNGRNEVYFTNIDGRSGTLGVCYSRWSFCFFSSSLSETDVAFDAAESWYTGSPSWGGSGISFQLVALHEFGHSLGLLHSNGQLDTMNSFYANGGPIGHYRSSAPHADARRGIRYLYPQSGSSVRDVAALNYKRTGSGSSGLISSPTYGYRGSYVNLECTFENLGTVTSTFDIGFYLSTNDYISTGDRLLGTNYNAWGSSGFCGTFSRSLYIPTTVTPGWYYIGVLLDKNHEISENIESNNYLAAPRRIRIY